MKSKLPSLNVPSPKTFGLCCSFYFLYRANRRRGPKKAEEQYDEDDPEAYKDMEVPDKVGGIEHPSPVVLSHCHVMYMVHSCCMCQLV